MSVVVITGAAGFVGRNLLAALAQRQEHEALAFDVGDGEDELRQGLARADFVFHLAGVNRPKDPGEFRAGNAGLTQRVLDALAESGRAVPFVLTSSIQAALDNPYGASKREAEQAVFAWADRTGGRALVYRLPNLFGKWCRPNYNSAVATFCHNIARDLPIEISDPARELELLYIDDLVAELLRALDGRPNLGDDGRCHVSKTHRIALGMLADVLRGFRASRDTLVLPDFSCELTKALYATYVSYLPEDGFAYAADMKRDDRGWLVELIKGPAFGQIFVSRTKPGITRGNHWHHTKVEKFIVIEGQAVIRFRQIVGDQVLEYPVSGEDLRIVDIPTGYTHSIVNVGSTDVITLFWTDMMFDPGNPDTYYLEV